MPPPPSNWSRTPSLSPAPPDSVSFPSAPQMRLLPELPLIVSSESEPDAFSMPVSVSVPDPPVEVPAPRSTVTPSSAAAVSYVSP